MSSRSRWRTANRRPSQHRGILLDPVERAKGAVFPEETNVEFWPGALPAAFVSVAAGEKL
jgi:hypothetical protein